MGSSFAVDAGQQSIRIRVPGEGSPVIEEFPGLTAKQPLAPQWAAAITGAAERHGLTVDEIGVSTTPLLHCNAHDLLKLVAPLGVGGWPSHRTVSPGTSGRSGTLRAPRSTPAP